MLSRSSTKKMHCVRPTPNLLLTALLSLLLAPALSTAEDEPSAVFVDYSPSTLVVFNKNVKVSQELAEFYTRVRGIPRNQMVGLSCPDKETITRAEFVSTIEGPLKDLFDSNKWWVRSADGAGERTLKNKIKIIAVIHRMPLRIAPPLPRMIKNPATDALKPKSQRYKEGALGGASVDSELMRLGVGSGVIKGALSNPYYQRDEAFAKAALPQILLAARIDGPSEEIAKRLITDAMAVEKGGLWGKVYIDLAQKTSSTYKEGEEWIAKSGQHFLRAGFPAVVDTRRATFPLNYPMSDAAVYFGWYTHTADGPFRNSEFRFKQGAIAAHLYSYSGSTVRSTKHAWVGPLLTKGAAAVLGNVYEPLLTPSTHFDIFSDRLIKGYTVAESAAMATPGVSWQTIVVGDPLYRPFRKVEPLLNRNIDYDYKTFHLAMQRWGDPDQKKDLFKNLEVAAKKQRSGNLYEALGQLSQEYYPKKLRTASKYYDDAFKLFREPKDKLRVRLTQIDMIRRTRGKEMAVSQLEELVADQRYANIPELEAAKVTLTQLNPPPPDPDPK
jgi:uncharacterized protein (TIGR03790 family)